MWLVRRCNEESVAPGPRLHVLPCEFSAQGGDRASRVEREDAKGRYRCPDRSSRSPACFRMREPVQGGTSATILNYRHAQRRRVSTFFHTLSGGLHPGGRLSTGYTPGRGGGTDGSAPRGMGRRPDIVCQFGIDVLVLVVLFNVEISRLSSRTSA